MKTTLSKVLADYGMVLVLLLLCSFFSAVTYTEQSVTGAASIQQLASSAKSGERVLLVGGATQVDLAAIEELAAKVKATGASVADRINGDPRAARLALEHLASTGGVDTILCTELAGKWLLFENLARDLPALANTRVIKPARYFFPNFLKADNLLNIANQIAVIDTAIVRHIAGDAF